MEKLVVTIPHYEAGDVRDEFYCFDYISKEAFCEDLEKAAMEALKFCPKPYGKQIIYGQRFYFKGMICDLSEIFHEVNEEIKYIFGKITTNVGTKDNPCLVKIPPYVETLEEWFEEKKKERENCEKSS